LNGYCVIVLLVIKVFMKRLQLFFSFLIVIALVVWASIFSHYKADTNNNFKVYFLNVGQGDAEYIKFPNGEDVLIDGGPDNSVLSELGKVMSFGDRKIDLVILTHPHADHLTGLIPVINRFEIGEVWETGVEYPSATYDAFENLISQKGITDTIAMANLQKSFGSAKISVLYPLSSLKNLGVDNINNASIVSELDYNQFSALFPGDLETTAQSQIYDKLHAVTVLKVDHHGSTNGTDDNWLSVLRPAVAVIEVGAKNTYGHPAPSTIDLLKKYAAQIYRTDQNGTIEIESDGVSWWKK
jgi:competence protein ComEC